MKPFALVAISSRNSYYSVKNMTLLFGWAKMQYEDFNVFVMDAASKYNLMALGYNETRAIKITRKNDQNLINKIMTSLENAGAKETKIIRLSDLEHTERYCELYDKYYSYFESNVNFRNDCLEATKEASPNADINIAVNYLLAELPIWFDIPFLLNIHSAVLVYKDLTLSWRKICYNYDLLSTNQEFMIKCF